MLPGLHVAVFLFSALLKVGSGDDASVDRCKLPDGVFPDPENCAQFIRCRSGVPDVELCSDKLLYNPLTLTCDFSKTEKCSEPTDFEITTPVETSDVACSEDGPNIYIIQSSCTEYYICKNDTAFKVKCPRDLQMNANKMTCDYPENVDCDEISIPEESSVGIKAIYRDDKEESAPETSVALSSTDSNSASADSSFSTNPENQTFLPGEKSTNENALLKETDQPKVNETLSKVTPTQTMFDQNITTTTPSLVATRNTKDLTDKIISSTSTYHRERSNLEDSTTENSKTDDEITSITTEINLSSDAFYDYASGESSKPSLYDDSESITVLKPRDEDINGSGSDVDVIDIFTPDSKDESQKVTSINVSKDEFTENFSISSKSLTPTNYTLSSNEFTEDELMTPNISSTIFENESTLDSEENNNMTKVTDNLPDKEIISETTKSEDFLSSQKGITKNTASLDNLTPSVKITETIIVTDSNLNDNTTHSTILSSHESAEDEESKNYTLETTKIQTTVIETDSKIAPGTTVTTQALMSSDPLTDNETTKITTSTFSKTAKVTPKYTMDSTDTTEEYQSINPAVDESTSRSEEQNEGYKTSAESVNGSHLTLEPSLTSFTEESVVGIGDISSSKQNENSILPEEYTEVSNMDTTFEDISNKHSSFSNEGVTSSLSQLQSNPVSFSSFTNEAINIETETVSSGHIIENDVSEAYDLISPENTPHILTETDINEETLYGILNSTYLNETSDSNFSDNTVTSESMTETSQNTYSNISLTTVYPTKEIATVSEIFFDSDVTSDNNNSLTSTPLTTDDFTVEGHITTKMSTKHSQITSKETIMELHESTKSSTLEYATNTGSISVFTENKNKDLSLITSSSKMQPLDNTTEEIDLSSESDVSKVDPTYIDMYTNNSVSSLANSTDTFITAGTANQEDLTSNFHTSMKENLNSTFSEVSTLSTSEKFQSTHMEISSDSDILLYNVTEVIDINVTGDQLRTSEKESFNTSESITKDTRANSKETGFPDEILSSSVTKESTNPPDYDFVSGTTKEATDSSTLSSIRYQSEVAKGNSETDIDDMNTSTLGFSNTEYIVSNENQSTVNSYIQNLNDTTVTDLSNSISNEVTQTSFETDFETIFSTDQNDNTSPTLSTNTDIYKTTSNSIHTGSSTVPSANLKSSKYTENFEHGTTDPITLETVSMESTTEINKTSQVPEGTGEDFGNNNKINTVIKFITDTSATEETVTNMYETSTMLETMDPFQNISAITSSSVMENINETSKSFWPETKEVTTENNSKSILVTNTTNIDLISVTDVPNEISNVVSTINVTDLYDEISSDITKSTTSYSNYSSPGITGSLITDHSIGIKTEPSESPEYDINDGNATSAILITSAKDSYSANETENTKPTEEPKITKETTGKDIAELTSTTLNSPDTSETSHVTGRRIEESSPNIQTNFDILSKTTLHTDWPTKSDTDFQTLSSGSIDSDGSVTDINSFDLGSLSTFNTSDIETSTKFTVYNETSEEETVSESSTFPSRDNLLNSTDILENTPIESSSITSETTSNAITGISSGTTYNILSNSTNVSYSSENYSNAVNTAEFSSSVFESTAPSTHFKHENFSTSESGVDLSTYDKASTDFTNKIVFTSTLTTDLSTEDPVEILTSETDFSRISVTENEIPSVVTAMTRGRTEADNFINSRTETTSKTTNTESINTTITTDHDDTRENDNSFSTSISSAFETTIMQTESSDGISESDLLTIPEIKTTVLMNETTPDLYTDITNASIASRNLETEISSTAYFTTALRTEMSHPSSNIATESEFTSTDIKVSETTVTESHSTDITETHLPVNFTTDINDFDDRNETTTESNMDFSSISVTSRNIEGETESSEYESTTHYPAAFRTETSHSSFNTETESELQRISSSDTPSESSTTVNSICVTLEGNFPYPDDCNKFYHCAKGVPELSSCVGTEHFDPIKRICTDPCLAKCDPNADCGTTESKTNTEEASSQTTLLEDNSTSESYTTESEGTFETIATDYFTEDTTPTLISKSTSNEISTANSIFQSSTLESTTGKDDTYSLTPSGIVTKDMTETTSDGYIDLSSTDVTIPDSNWTVSDIPITSTRGTYEITSGTEAERTGSTSTATNTETMYETPFTTSETTVYTEVSSDSSGDGEDASSASTSMISTTECENGDCFSSKAPTSATFVPFSLCPRTDFLSQPNCNEYLDCTNQVPNKLECPTGLHFNPTTRVCDWPYTANCGALPKPLYEPTDSFKCPCKSCLMPSTVKCSHYYLCLGYAAYEMKCSSSLLFDRSRNTCNFAPLVDCIDLNPSTEIEPTENSTKISTHFSSSTTVSSTTASFVCPSREGLFRYPGNCGMFYQCSNWAPNVMRCAATTHFSEITQRCEYPCDAKCDLTLNCGRSSTAAPSDPRCSCLNCRLPSPESCTKYIVCVNGRARIEYCPWGKTFDARRSTCDWAHKVACRHSSICPERNGLFSHKEDCHKFVHCSNGIPYVKNCPSVLEFDPIKKRCEWPTGRCNYLPIITRDVDYRNEDIKRKGWKCPKTFGYFSDAQHCSKFYHCSFGTPTLKECSPGLLYNSRYQTCDWGKKVRCHSNRHQKPRKCRVYDHHIICSDDRKPKPHVLCNMYYDCTAGRACAKQCPVGLYFNNMTGVCDLPKNVKCLNPGKEDYSLKDLSLKCASGDYARQVNPTNDSCFYHCRQGKVVSGCCSKGHVYNLHKDKCERRTKSLRI